MSTLVLLSVLSLILIPPSKSQTYEDCGSTSIISGVTLSLARDVENEMVQISITGPTSVWFGYGFGSSSMNNGYAIIAEEDDEGTYLIRERKLSCCSSPPGTILTSSATNSIATTGSITLERPYTVTNGGYDFTNLFTCQTDSVKIIAAYGKGLTMSKHDAAEGGETFTPTCGCPTTAPTTAIPTESPITAQPTTAAPTTAAPTGVSFVECATSLVLSPMTLSIERNEMDQEVRIIITGPNDGWFGYGFGSRIMNGI